MDTLTPSQRKATAAFHRRMAKWFRKLGRLEDAKTAEKYAEILEKGQ